MSEAWSSGADLRHRDHSARRDPDGGSGGDRVRGAVCGLRDHSLFQSVDHRVARIGSALGSGAIVLKQLSDLAFNLELLGAGLMAVSPGTTLQSMVRLYPRQPSLHRRGGRSGR